MCRRWILWMNENFYYQNHDFNVIIIHSQEFTSEIECTLNNAEPIMCDDNLWASGANQSMNNNAMKRIWPEYIVRNSSKTLRRRKRPIVQTWEILNKIENCLIASNTFVSINPNDDNFFVWNRLFSLFRQLNSTANEHFSW